MFRQCGVFFVFSIISSNNKLQRYYQKCPRVLTNWPVKPLTTVKYFKLCMYVETLDASIGGTNTTVILYATWSTLLLGYISWFRFLIMCYSFLSKNLSSPPIFNGVRVTRSLVLCVCFLDRCLFFCPFSFGHFVVCSSSIYRFWLPLCIFKLFLWICRKFIV